MTTTISNIKTKFKERIGEDIVITVEAGRRRTKTHEGVLSEAYPAVFIVELDNGEDDDLYERVSFSYRDILTNTIEVDFPDEITEADLEEEKEIEEV